MTANPTPNAFRHDAPTIAPPTILSGWITDEQVAAELGFSLFTVRYRLQLPFIRVGKKRFIEPATARKTLLERAEKKHQPRSRGRPGNAT